MGFTEVLTTIFIVLKLLGVINWNWFLVLLPELLALIFYMILILIIAGKNKDDFWKDEK